MSYSYSHPDYARRIRMDHYGDMLVLTGPPPGEPLPSFPPAASPAADTPARVALLQDTLARRYLAARAAARRLSQIPGAGDAASAFRTEALAIRRVVGDLIRFRLLAPDALSHFDPDQPQP